MCGIAGIMSSHIRDGDQLVRSMCELLRHRGPDAQGIYTDPQHNVFLGHRRLSIIDLSAMGNQPMRNEDGSLLLVANGEIYNYRELRRELMSRGHRFSSASDSEVVLHGYEEWNEEVFERLEGIFALAIWDSEAQRLVLARDHLGVKPLVFIENGSGIFFSSEAKAFQCLPENVFRRTFDPDSLRQLIAFQYLFEPSRTAYTDVERLPPGSYLIYEAGQRRVIRYWRLRANKELEGLSPDAAIRCVEEKLERAVRSQLVSDVPVGILLSGGLDSSVVAALAARNMEGTLCTFTAGFEHHLDERPYARMVADYIGSRHREILIEPEEINARLPELVPLLDDLTSLDGGMFTTRLICSKIRELGIKVLLVGEGADELFGGYSWFGLSQLPFSMTGQSLRAWLFCYCISRMLPTRNSYEQYRKVASEMQLLDEGDICRTIGRFELTRQLPNHFLMKVDHGSMSQGIEARVPYLDRDLVETVFSLPRRFKVEGNWFSMAKANEKMILKKCGMHHLPAEIIGRKKRGFSIPMAEVLKANWTMLADLLLSESSIARLFFNRIEIERLFTFKTRMYLPQDKHKEFLCWRLLLIEIWRRHYGVSV